jgi:hypothetical protein
VAKSKWPRRPATILPRHSLPESRAVSLALRRSSCNGLTSEEHLQPSPISQPDLGSLDPGHCLYTPASRAEMASTLTRIAASRRHSLGRLAPRPKVHRVAERGSIMKTRLFVAAIAVTLPLAACGGGAAGSLGAADSEQGISRQGIYKSELELLLRDFSRLESDECWEVFNGSKAPKSTKKICQTALESTVDTTTLLSGMLAEESAGENDWNSTAASTLGRVNRGMIDALACVDTYGYGGKDDMDLTCGGQISMMTAWAGDITTLLGQLEKPAN